MINSITWRVYETYFRTTDPVFLPQLGQSLYRCRGNTHTEEFIRSAWPVHETDSRVNNPGFLPQTGQSLNRCKDDETTEADGGELHLDNVNLDTKASLSLYVKGTIRSEQLHMLVDSGSRNTVLSLRAYVRISRHKRFSLTHPKRLANKLMEQKPKLGAQYG